MRQRAASTLASSGLGLLVCALALMGLAPLSDAGTPAPSLTGAAFSNAGPRLRAVDGTADYYGRFPGSLPTRRSFFPVGVWFESVLNDQDTDLDKAAGLNTYVELTANSQPNVIKAAGMYGIANWGADQTAAYLLPDEVDMWAGPGNAAWTGNYPGQGSVCEPDGVPCGYTIARQLTGDLPAKRLVFANYGKGVTFWETRREAATFVNAFPDVVSADNYWFTDPNICGVSEGASLLGRDRALTKAQCRLAANYGRTVSHLRSLVSPSRSIPVWGFVELGHPASEDWTPTIAPRQIRAAVWSSIIHGARGIIYFNHNFGGPCLTQHVLRDACGRRVRPMVTSVNRQIRSLAPVLNARFVDGLVTSSGPVDIAVKLYGGHFYVLAGSSAAGDHTVTMRFRCGRPTSAAVLGEHRTRRIHDGRLTDRFGDANAVHIYRVSGGTTCGLR